MTMASRSRKRRSAEKLGYPADRRVVFEYSAEAPVGVLQSLYRFLTTLDDTSETRLKPTDTLADVILWGEDRRIVTGADLLGRLLRGIVSRQQAK